MTKKLIVLAQVAEINMSNFKNKNEEIAYLGQMLGATREEDTQRLNSIGKRLIELSTWADVTVREEI